MYRVLGLIIISSLLFGCTTKIAPNDTNIIKTESGDVKMNTYATINTNKGDITFKIFNDLAPITSENFIKLAKTGYYNNVTFHRVIPNFMIQTGDQTGTGRGGPGYAIKDEFTPLLRHDSPGIVSMANSGPNTGGSQFFITHVPTPWLDDKHSIFGKVTEGMDVVNSIKAGDIMKSVTIFEKWFSRKKKSIQNEFGTTFGID